MAGEFAGVAGAVPAFVMSADGVDPFAEPVGHRCDEFLAARSDGSAGSPTRRRWVCLSC